MKTSDFRNKPTSSQLKENMNKMFGVNVNFNKYSREQLEDMRNKLRTRVFQQEGKAGINDLLTNETYQKDKAMLALLNTRIKEMLGENLKQLKDKMIELSEAKKGVRAPKFTKKAAGAKPDFLDMDKDGDKKEPMKKAVADKKVKEGFPTVDDAKKAAAGTAGMKQGEKKKSSTGGEITKTATGLKHTAGKNYGGKDAPKAPDSDKKVKKESIAQEGKKTKAADKKVKEAPNEGNAFGKAVRAAKADGVQAGEKVKVGGKTYPVKESVWKTQITKESMDIYKRHVKIVNESLGYLINEDEEGKAKAITAAGDMVNDFTSWMQRVGQYQTKTMIELADAIKADFGAAEAEAFKQAVGPALSATLETLTQQREAVSGAVAVLAGEATPDAAMGMDPGMDAGMPPAEPGMDMAPPDEMNAPAGDEFGASDAAAGMGTTGREMRESKFARKLAESHSILSKLAK